MILAVPVAECDADALHGGAPAVGRAEMSVLISNRNVCGSLPTPLGAPCEIILWNILGFGDVRLAWILQES
ncbi:Zonadhesin [Manis pentadactyla]|nr:Zonadhesin [Manis pentadactyla]